MAMGGLVMDNRRIVYIYFGIRLLRRLGISSETCRKVADMVMLECPYMDLNRAYRECEVPPYVEYNEEFLLPKHLN